MIVLENDVFH